MLYLSISFQKNNALYALPFNKLLLSTIVEIIKGYSTSIQTLLSSLSTIVEIIKGYSN